MQKQTIRVPQRSRLLSLPAEIRLIIYKHVFASEIIDAHTLKFRSSIPYQRPTAGSKARLLLTCRMIAEEATSSLYAYHIFRFSYSFEQGHPSAQEPLDLSRKFGIFSRVRLAMLCHVSMSYSLSNDVAALLKHVDASLPGEQAGTDLLDESITEVVSFLRRSCPKMKSFTVEMSTGPAPRMLGDYCAADLIFPERYITTGPYGRELEFKVRDELAKMSCSEAGDGLERLRVVVASAPRISCTMMHMAGAGVKRWQPAISTVGSVPVWVFAVDKDYKEARRNG